MSGTDANPSGIPTPRSVEAYTMLDTMVYVRFGLRVELLAIELKPDPATNVTHTLFTVLGLS